MTTQTWPARPRKIDLSSETAQGTLVATGATIGMASGFGCLALTSVFIAPLGDEFGWSKSEVSACYTLAAVGMALGGIIWGRLSDRVDARILLALGGSFLFLPLLAMSQASALWHFQVANFALGLAGFGCLYAPLVAAAGEWFENRRGLVMGIVTAGGALGQGVMPFAAEQLIGNFGWREAFLVIGIVVFALQLAVGLLVRRRAAPAPAPAPAGSARFRVFATRRIAALALAAFLCCACMGVPLIHLAGFVSAVCGSPSLGATSLLVAMVFGAIGRVCFGLIADRYGNLFAYMGASAVQSACILLFPALQSELSLLTLSAVFGFGFAGNMTCLLLCVRDEADPAHLGSSIGSVLFIGWAGMGVGGYLGGALFDMTGAYTLAFLIAAAFGAGNLLVLSGLAITRTPYGGARVTAGALQDVDVEQ